jgi:tetratricopeptide (TPR) repeat protein
MPTRQLSTGKYRHLADTGLDPDLRAQQCCRLAREFEEAGEYEAAAEALGELWQGIGQRPRVEGFSGETVGEVLLRAGALTGWLGSASGVEGAQESAKDLLSESAAVFESLPDPQKAAEARVELACCYWREGAFDEARLLLRSVLESPGARQPSRQRAMALLRLAVVDSSDSRYRQALELLTEAAPLFELEQSAALKGKFHNERANALNCLYQEERGETYLDRALIEYTAAGYHFKHAGHTRNEAAVENNLGVLYISAGRFEDARSHLTHARRLFTRLKDRTAVAQVDETRARLHLSEGLHGEAEQAARAAVRALEKGGELALLGEALVTHATTLARLGRDTPAQVSFARAAETLLHAGSAEGAGSAYLLAINELGERLPSGELLKFYEHADALLGRAERVEALERLRLAARVVLAAFRRAVREGERPRESAAEGDTPALREGFSLKEEVRRLEAHYIELALREAGGRVSHAAKLLGFEDHGSLNALLKHKHPQLFSARLPRVPRKRSILKKRH